MVHVHAFEGYGLWRRNSHAVAVLVSNNVTPERHVRVRTQCDNRLACTCMYVTTVLIPLCCLGFRAQGLGRRGQFGREGEGGWREEWTGRGREERGEGRGGRLELTS